MSAPGQTSAGRRQRRKTAPLLIGASLLLATLGACGKTGAPEPPEEIKSEYNYPRTYPAPLPGSGPGDVPSEEESAAEAGILGPGRGRLTPFPVPSGVTTTRTYGTLSE